MNLSTLAKAVTAGLAAGLLVFDASTVLQSAGGEGVTLAEWIRVGASTLIAGLAVYAVPNDTKSA